MQHIQHGYRSLTLLMEINWDRLLYVGKRGMGALEYEPSERW